MPSERPHEHAPGQYGYVEYEATSPVALVPDKHFVCYYQWCDLDPEWTITDNENGVSEQACGIHITEVLLRLGVRVGTVVKLAQ